MVCSKLFSGDLPEISSYIIQNLRNNISTLYSLTLVNRFWCRLAIPLLWEDPFSVKCRGNLPSQFIDTYFLFLSDDDKSKMKTKFYSKFDLNLHKPLFNYPSLIKTINFYRIRLHVTNWFSINSVQHFTFTSFQLSSKNYLQLIDLRNEPYKSVNSEEETGVFTILLRLFIENNASLNNLYTSEHYYKLNQFYDMILNHPKFISEIEIFSFDYFDYYQPENTPTIQKFLSSLLSISIKHISLFTYRIEIENYLANIIQSQTRLSSVKFCCPKILDSLKHSSNTLTSINFYSFTFSNTMRFDALSYLTQLESLQFKSCNGIISKVIQPLLSISTPLKIKTFVFSDNLMINLIEEVTSIQLLIQKIGSYIENLDLSIYDDELRRKIFDVIINSCKNIKFLNLNCIDLENISQLSKMILNFNNYLKYLTLKIKFHDYDDDLKISSMILNELSKSLPPSLHYLDLKLVINPDDLQIAFESCKQVELKKLLIRNYSKNSMNTTLNVIKDFVKEKKLEFLAYYILYSGRACHKSLEESVEEIKSFIKIVSYYDLVISISEIDGNLTIG